MYFDYLTENYYLVHPSMAGVNLVGGKLRMTARKQWFDQVEAPNLQTLTADLRLTKDLVLELLYLMIKMDITHKRVCI